MSNARAVESRVYYYFRTVGSVFYTVIAFQVIVVERMLCIFNLAAYVNLVLGSINWLLHIESFLPFQQNFDSLSRICLARAIESINWINLLSGVCGQVKHFANYRLWVHRVKLNQGFLFVSCTRCFFLFLSAAKITGSWMFWVFMENIAQV